MYRLQVTYCKSFQWLVVGSLFAYVGVSSTAGGSAGAQDWNALRGANGYGSVRTDGILASSSDVELKVRWRKKLGSGYSSVVVSGDRAVTMYSDGDKDQIACFDVRDGSTLWQVATGPAFKGSNGSFDGPLSTPLIHDNHVFALSAVGKFFCVRLSDGAQVWTRDLQKEEDARQPMYGFTTSPIVVGETLILQLGAKDRTLAGIDPKTGTTKWAIGDDAIDSQSPAMMQLGGVQVVLAAGAKKLAIVEPNEGRVLGEYEHQGGNSSAMMPIPFGENKVLLTLDDRFSKVISLRPEGEGIAISEEWKDRSIRNSYNVPAVLGDQIFAYSTRILTCVDAKTGKAIWKNRKPGDGFLVVVDGHLIVSTKRGGLYLAKASKEGYQQLSGLELFKDRVWSIPAYSKNAIFVRSLGEIACVDIVSRTGGIAEASEAPLPVSPRFAQFLADVKGAKDDTGRQQVVKQFIDDQTKFPIVEEDIVHFVYQGKATDVAVASDVFGARQERKMRRIPGTDCFYYSMKLPRDQRANYAFVVDFQMKTDPRNPRSFTSSIYVGEMEFAALLPTEPPLKMSWFAMPQWKQPSYTIDLPAELSGKIESHSIPSELLNSNFEVEIYTPPGYDSAGDTRYPVVYFVDGTTALEKGNVAQVADNLFRQAQSGDEKGSVPSVLVFIKSFGRGPQLTKAFVSELVAFVDENHATIAERAGRGCIGFGFSAGMALNLAAAEPAEFGSVSLLSPMVFPAQKGALLEQLSKTELPMHFYIDWGRYDMHNPDENWDIRQDAQTLFEDVRKISGFEVTGGQVNDSSDWSSWRNRFDRVLLAR